MVLTFISTLVIMLALAIMLFIVINYLLSIPGNKKIDKLYNEDDKEDKHIKKKGMLWILLILLVIFLFLYLHQNKELIHMYIEQWMDSI